MKSTFIIISIFLHKPRKRWYYGIFLAFGFSSIFHKSLSIYGTTLLSGVVNGVVTLSCCHHICCLSNSKSPVFFCFRGNGGTVKFPPRSRISWWSTRMLRFLKSRSFRVRPQNSLTLIPVSRSTTKSCTPACFCRLSHNANDRNLHFKKLLSKCRLDTLEQAFDTLKIDLLNTQS